MIIYSKKFAFRRKTPFSISERSLNLNNIAMEMIARALMCICGHLHPAEQNILEWSLKKAGNAGGKQVDERGCRKKYVIAFGNIFTTDHINNASFFIHLFLSLSHMLSLSR